MLHRAVLTDQGSHCIQHHGCMELRPKVSAGLFKALPARGLLVPRDKTSDSLPPQTCISITADRRRVRREER